MGRPRGARNVATVRAPNGAMIGQMPEGAVALGLEQSPGHCRVHGCNGELRWAYDSLGRVYDICQACEQRVNAVAPVLAAAADRHAMAERLVKAEEIAKRLRAQIEFLHARGLFVWEPGLCVRCGSEVNYHGRGRIPLYCDAPACMPSMVKNKRRRGDTGAAA